MKQPDPQANRTELLSWGRTVHASQEPLGIAWSDVDLAPLAAGKTLLPYGLGRSYGDSCLNDGGALLVTRALDHFLAFDLKTGVLRCEAGVTLAQILALAVPRGFFLPVTPGTKFVTAGGALANDVHGKNHHRAGTFGMFVRAFELVRSDGSRRVCTPEVEPELFRATVGGLGLTGLVTWIELQLRPIETSLVDVESVKFGGLNEFFALNAESERQSEYTVAWIDSLARGASLGRGHYLRGDHARGPGPLEVGATGRLAVPLDAPGWVLNPLTIRALNTTYHHLQQRRVVRSRVPYGPYFYPLDGIADWNRAYGKQGFFQYQCVVPPPVMRDAMRAILAEVAKSRQASFVTVLKTFGELQSPGMLSFPRPGATVALDFSNRGDVTRRLFERLDALVEEAGGAVYPAKDACLSAARFRRFFPAWEHFSAHVDPRFSSSFWRRVTAAP